MVQTLILLQNWRFKSCSSSGMSGPTTLEKNRVPSVPQSPSRSVDDETKSQQPVLADGKVTLSAQAHDGQVETPMRPDPNEFYTQGAKLPVNGWNTHPNTYINNDPVPTGTYLLT